MKNEMKIGKSYITKDGRKLELLNTRVSLSGLINDIIYDFKSEEDIYLSFGSYQMNVNFK